MISYLACDTAREMLELFMDGELPTADQVAVQAHLHVCSTCALHVQDMALIGWSVRAGTPEINPAADDARALAIIQSGVLTRIRAERAQSLRVRIPEMFVDMRLFWPALGATAAVFACLYGSVNIWQLTNEKRPNSMSGIIDTLASQGSDSHPLQLNTDMSMPVFLEESFGLEPTSEEEAAYTVAAVVTQAGLVGKAELVDVHRADTSDAAARPGEGQAVLKAVRSFRFSPAQVRSGRPVAVTTVLLITQTTIREPAQPVVDPVRATVRTPTPRPKDVPVPAGARSMIDSVSTTA